MMTNLLFQRPAEKDSYMVPSNTMYNQTTVSFEPISEKMSMKSVQKCPTCQTNKDRRNEYGHLPEKDAEGNPLEYSMCRSDRSLHNQTIE